MSRDRGDFPKLFTRQRLQSAILRYLTRGARQAERFAAGSRNVSLSTVRSGIGARVSAATKEMLGYRILARVR